ncbi:MAG: 50S ribosomal protein L22 [Candidatus Zixiibacteriota bacterium]|nr:MAG: 50S ribosomal protein L22 [candidate division Zixibacteria bacterium]HHI03448.1 50S ribosomal protein L22 [candidate division Zixibacteria bacterium]
MQAKARAKYLKTSPRKMRQVAHLIKGKPVEEALNILNYTPKLAAHYLAKTLKSAAANAMASVGTAKLKAEDLSVTNILVDQAPTAKRIRFQSMGRVFRLRKRFCHLTVLVEGAPEAETPKPTRRKRAKKDVATDNKPGDTGGEKKKTARSAKAEKADVEDKKEIKGKNSKIDNKTSANEKISDSENKSEEA